MGASLDQFIDYVVPILDVLLVAYLVYRGLNVIKGTRAAPMLGGLLALVALFFIASYAGFVTLHFVLWNFLSSLILVVVVVFQEEIRRGLTKVGLQPAFRRGEKTAYDKTIEDITLVVSRCSDEKIGALIVIQREVGLEDFIEDAVELDAILNRKLLFSLFLKDSPLHDGATIIENNRIKAAGCVLPLSFNPDLDPNLGTRHRAALGISERSDALIVVVSEENGSISLVRDGKINRNLEASTLRELLHNSLSKKRPEVREGESG